MLQLQPCHKRSQLRSHDIIGVVFTALLPLFLHCCHQSPPVGRQPGYTDAIGGVYEATVSMMAPLRRRHGNGVQSTAFV
jgi:hypothetical protein